MLYTQEVFFLKRFIGLIAARHVGAHPYGRCYALCNQLFSRLHHQAVNGKAVTEGGHGTHLLFHTLYGNTGIANRKVVVYVYIYILIKIFSAGMSGRSALRDYFGKAVRGDGNGLQTALFCFDSNIDRHGVDAVGIYYDENFPGPVYSISVKHADPVTGASLYNVAALCAVNNIRAGVKDCVYGRKPAGATAPLQPPCWNARRGR